MFPVLISYDTVLADLDFLCGCAAEGRLRLRRLAGAAAASQAILSLVPGCGESGYTLSVLAEAGRGAGAVGGASREASIRRGIALVKAARDLLTAVCRRDAVGARGVKSEQ